MMSNKLNDIFVEDIENITNELSEFYNDLEGKTVLIAGGKGFLGTYFKNVLIKINERLSNPIRIIIMDSLITSKDKDEENNSDVEFLEQDISKSFKIENNIDYKQIILDSFKYIDNENKIYHMEKEQIKDFQ